MTEGENRPGDAEKRGIGGNLTQIADEMSKGRRRKEFCSGRLSTKPSMMHFWTLTRLLAFRLGDENQMRKTEDAAKYQTQISKGRIDKLHTT